MEVVHVDALMHRLEGVEEAPHDAKAKNVDEFTMEEGIQWKLEAIFVKKEMKALKKVEPTFKREQTQYET